MRSRRRASARATLMVVLLLLLMVNMVAGCTSSGTSQPTSGALETGTKTITDMVGRTVEVPEHVDRIIGIGSSSLRVISYLQATDLVVGVEQLEHESKITCAYNYVYQDTFKDLPVIGEGGSKGVTPNEEAILTAAPQVIFASVDADTAQSLQERTGIPVVVMTLSDLVFDPVFYENVSLVGSIINRQERADELVQYMKDVEQDLLQRTSQISSGDVKTAYAAGISFRGGHGFAGTEAGFAPFESVKVSNIADTAAAPGAFDMDMEAVLSAQPQLIFIEGGNMPLVKEDYDANPDYFASLDAVKQNEVYSLIGYRFYATNIELALANCYQVGACAYPEQFSDIDPAKKLDEITEFFLGAQLSDDLAAAGYRFERVDITNL